MTARDGFRSVQRRRPQAAGVCAGWNSVLDKNERKN
jgi:hypothetical protein